MKYDIFISYRRKDSSGRSNVATARQFKMAFEGPPYNYKVFFDFNECTDNYFSEIILPAIRTCDFFVLVLTKDCLARCFNEGDWVRREIEEALANNRKIIPITPDNECNAWPNLPDSLRELDGLTITTIHTDHMFDACIDYLVKKRFHLDEGKSWVEEGTKRWKIERGGEIMGRWAKRYEKSTKIINGHEYVDLGLPSGTLWATCNVGAKKTDDFGDYSSWREDAVNWWGKGCSMPSKEQWMELMRGTKITWTTKNGVKGILFTANNGNDLFLPAAGYCYGDNVFDYAGSHGYYWSSSLNPDDSNGAWYFFISSDKCAVDYNDNRNRKQSVRAVYSAK